MDVPNLPINTYIYTPIYAVAGKNTCITTPLTKNGQTKTRFKHISSQYSTFLTYGHINHHCLTIHFFETSQPQNRIPATMGLPLISLSRLEKRPRIESIPKKAQSHGLQIGFNEQRWRSELCSDGWLVVLLMDKILHHLGWLKPYK